MKSQILLKSLRNYKFNNRKSPTLPDNDLKKFSTLKPDIKILNQNT